MKKFFLLCISLFLFAAIFSFSAKAESIVPEGVEHVDSFNVIIHINPDSTVSVQEVVEYDFGRNTKPGVDRYIPLKYRDFGGDKLSVEVSDISVSDENGNPYPFKQEKIEEGGKKEGYLKIFIGDENQPSSGKKKYVIRYKISGAIKFFNDHDQLFWDVTGKKWPVYVKYPEVEIILPQKIESEKVSKNCFIGIKEATIECVDRNNGRKEQDVHYSYKGAVAGESMAVTYDFPKGIVQKPENHQQTFWESLKTNRKMQFAILAGSILLGTCLILIAVYLKKIQKIFHWKKWLEQVSAATKKAKTYLLEKIKRKSLKWWAAAFLMLLIVLISGGSFFWKIRTTLNKISTKGESIGSIVHASLGGEGQVKGESEGQINILLLGMLGANHPGGGLNTDTIMVASIRPQDNKIALVSIPRDLWVTDPGRDNKSKINAVYVYGEEKGAGQGIADMESLVGEITGLPIHYTAMVSTEGFSRLVNILGGVEIELAKPFEESAQFEDIKVCDAETYTIPTGETQQKKNKKGKVVAEYPLCKNKNPECGGDFHLPAGKNNLSGEQALCFVRSRYLTSDFERAKRQQLVLKQLKQKVTQLGITDFGKISQMLDNLGDNVRTDMQLWEMRRLFDIYKGMDDIDILQRVLEDSKKGLLYSPDKTPETGFILLPRGDDYDKIRELFQNIFRAKD